MQLLFLKIKLEILLCFLFVIAFVTEVFLNIFFSINIFFLTGFLLLQVGFGSSLFFSEVFNFIEIVLSVEILLSEIFIDFCELIKGRFYFCK